MQPFSGHLGAVVVLLTSCAFVGCGGEMRGGDAGADAGGDAARDGGGGLDVTPPDIPWLLDGTPPVMLTPCPPGWHEVHGGDVTECDPYPTGGAHSCGAGEAHFPGEPECRPIGDPCPPGDYGTSVPAGGLVVYVRASASAGGDGSVETPFATLSEVPWLSLTAETTVALGKGSYAGSLPLKAGVTVVGACAEETVLTGILAPVVSVVSVTSAGEPALVENLTIRGAPLQGAAVRRGRRLSLRGVLIDGVRGLGVFADGAGSAVSLTDVAIRDTQPGDSPQAGVGAWAQYGATLEATRLLVVDNRGYGLRVLGEGASMTLVQTAVRDTQPRDDDGRRGEGIDVGTGARLDAREVLVSGNHGDGIFAHEPGSVALLTDVIVRDTALATTGGLHGNGIGLQDGAALTATRLLLTGNQGNGIFMDGTDTEAVLSDGVIRGTSWLLRDEMRAHGLSVQSGARLDGARLVISGAMESGSYAANAETVVSLTDALIQYTARGRDTDFARAVTVQSGGRFVGARVLAVANQVAGIVVADAGSTIELADAVVRDTGIEGDAFSSGQGLLAVRGGALEGTRLEVDGSTSIGLFAIGGGRIALSDTTIRDIGTTDCPPELCAGAALGYGAIAYSGTVSLTRFAIADAAVCGVLVSPMEGRPEVASLDLEAGRISGALVGACVQVEGYDVGRLTADVLYQDNGTNLDTTMLPLPSVPR